MSLRIPGLVHLLDAHGPTQLRDAALALDTTAGDLRAEIQAFCDVEATGQILEPLFLIEPLGGWPDDDSDPEPCDSDVVRFATGMGPGASGIAHQDAAVLGPLLAAASQLRAMEPDNLELAAAVDKLTATMMRGTVGQATYRSLLAAQMQQAARQRHQLRILYSNAWRPRVGSRVVDPYRVVSTSRGYELDAGPLDRQGRPRSYLLARIRDFEVLDSTFTRPDGLAEALATNRELTRVRGFAAHRGLWAVRHFSERCELEESDAEGSMFTAWLLPPVDERVGLMLLLAGPEAYLEDPALDRLREEKAAELAAHHGLRP